MVKSAEATSLRRVEPYLYRGSLTGIREASDISALTRPAARTFSLRLAHRLARSRPQQKNRATLRVLLLEPGRSSPILARPGALGLDFSSRNALIFEPFRRAHAFVSEVARSQQNTVKTDTKHTSEHPRANAKTTNNRSVSMFGSARYSKHARTPLRAGPGASRDWPRDAFGRLPAALGSPGALQDQPPGEFWASR